VYTVIDMLYKGHSSLEWSVFMYILYDGQSISRLWVTVFYVSNMLEILMHGHE